MADACTLPLGGNSFFQLSLIIYTWRVEIQLVLLWHLFGWRLDLWIGVYIEWDGEWSWLDLANIKWRRSLHLSLPADHIWVESLAVLAVLAFRKISSDLGKLSLLTDYRNCNFWIANDSFESSFYLIVYFRPLLFLLHLNEFAFFNLMFLTP